MHACMSGIELDNKKKIIIVGLEKAVIAFPIR